MNFWGGVLGALRIAARSLRRSPGFSVVTIVSLALGVSIVASTLSVMNSYVVRAMPVSSHAVDAQHRAVIRMFFRCSGKVLLIGLTAGSSAASLGRASGRASYKAWDA
jgi:hypothetical protein